MQAEIKPMNSLEKLFQDQQPPAVPVVTSGFRNEAISYQLAYRLTESTPAIKIDVQVESPAKAHVRLYQVRHVPVQMACYPDSCDGYLRKAPGLYPDLLREVKLHQVLARHDVWDVLWVTLDAKGTLPAGDYPVTLRLMTESGELLGQHTQVVTLLDALLPEQKLKHTKWLHADCLADYYRVKPFSEAHWRICEEFVRSAVDGGINMMLMPVHTLPLDTRIGGERTTTQLVKITVENGEYRFNMDDVRRWIRMCRGCGVKYHEVAHLFTQWGAEHAPKIVATVDGEEKRIFGWDTDATGPEYGRFLAAYIPALRQMFREEGIEEQVYWHISDEPSKAHLASYSAAKKQVENLLDGARIMDALSDFAFYQQGVVQHPVMASNHIQPFLDAKVEDLWMYYCCVQHKAVANTFIAMPGVRCRVLGPQLFRCRIAGFLQWGYNFYNAMNSDYPIDPYHITDADSWVPAGDPFQVYPGPDGKPELSMRWMHFREAMQDLRALELLAKRIGWEKANSLLDDMTLTHYPMDAQAYLGLREKINRTILEN